MWPSFARADGGDRAIAWVTRMQNDHRELSARHSKASRREPMRVEALEPRLLLLSRVHARSSCSACQPPRRHRNERAASAGRGAWPGGRRRAPLAGPGQVDDDRDAVGGGEGRRLDAAAPPRDDDRSRRRGDLRVGRPTPKPVLVVLDEARHVVGQSPQLTAGASLSMWLHPAKSSAKLTLEIMRVNTFADAASVFDLPPISLQISVEPRHRRFDAIARSERTYGDTTPSDPARRHGGARSQPNPAPGGPRWRLAGIDGARRDGSSAAGGGPGRGGRVTPAVGRAVGRGAGRRHIVPGGRSPGRRGRGPLARWTSRPISKGRPSLELVDRPAGDDPVWPTGSLCWALPDRMPPSLQVANPTRLRSPRRSPTASCRPGVAARIRDRSASWLASARR